MQHGLVKAGVPMTEKAHALVYAAPGQARIETVDLPPLGDGMIEVETLFSGLSRGTERLVFRGQVPPGEWARMRAPLQVGDFPFPVRYGYSAVGRVATGPDTGQTVFCLHPHQSRFRVERHWVVPVPDTVPDGRAVLAANMETALNALWDAAPRPGHRCLVVGAGMVGWLITCLLSRRSDLSVLLTDVAPETGTLANDLNVRFATPDAVPREAFDIAFHCAAAPAGLQTAIDALDFEGRVIELSWYGDKPVTVSLGGNFHANRLQIVGSQVGHVAPVRRGSTTRRDRLVQALAALADDRLDRLITDETPFRDLPAALPALLSDSAPGIATRIVY